MDKEQIIEFLLKDIKTEIAIKKDGREVDIRTNIDLQELEVLHNKAKGELYKLMVEAQRRDIRGGRDVNNVMSIINKIETLDKILSTKKMVGILYVTMASIELLLYRLEGKGMKFI